MNSTVKKDVWLCRDSYGGDTVFSFNPVDAGIDGYVVAGKGTATITLMDHADVVNAQIEALEKAKQLAQAECQQKLAKIDEKIQSLLAITHDGGEV